MSKEIMFCDTETHSLYGEICMFQYVGEKGKAKVVEYPDLKWLLKFIKKHHTVWYNASYDLSTVTYQSGKSLGLDYKVDDLFYASRTAVPELKKYSLDVLHDYYGMSYYDESLDKSKMQKSFTYAEAKKRRKATKEQIEYGKADVYTLRKLWRKKEIQKVVKKNKAYALDIGALKKAMVYQMNGIPVNRELLHAEQKKLISKIEANGKKLGELNPQSPKQCAEALGVVKTDKATLVRLISEGNELAQVIFDQRRLLKARKMLETWDFGKIHTFFNVAGTITGRFSAKGSEDNNGYVNAQQISRQYQYMFHDTRKNYVTFEVDYSTAELRAGCSIMNDETMYKELMEGKDLHIESAKLTGIKNPTREDRQKGKAVSFGLIFSMSAPSFQDYAFTNYGVTFSLKEAKAIHSKYHKKYKGIDKYHEWCWRNYTTTPIETALGRRNIANLGTDASNYATQGSIAEATKISIDLMTNDYPETLSMINNVVHDACYMTCKKKDFDKYSKILSKYMEKGWLEVCKSKIFHFKDIPMPVEVEVIGE